MSKKALRKNSIREIKLSFGRFLAILAIVALAIGMAFHGYRMNPEDEEKYRLGVNMGMSMIIVFAVLLTAGIVIRIISNKRIEKGTSFF